LHTPLSKGTSSDIAQAEDLKNELEAVKNRCNMLEKSVKDLQSRCDTHERILETFWKHIVGLESKKGDLDLTYQGEEFELLMQ